jgi:5-methyltetrahydropteroyltriglutamate--homocysteine methyltransferase
LGLGVVNPRIDEVETAEAIAGRARAALAQVEARRLFLNPDCGFGTFASRPMNSPETAKRKLQAVAEAARRLREQFD